MRSEDREAEIRELARGPRWSTVRITRDRISIWFRSPADLHLALAMLGTGWAVPLHVVRYALHPDAPFGKLFKI